MGTKTVFDRRTEPASAAAVLAAARDRRRTADHAEAELLQLAVDWAVMHPADSIHDPAFLVDRGGNQTDVALAGPGAPTIAEYAVAEFVAVLGMSPEAGKRYLGEAIELRYRLPRLWRRVLAGGLSAWKARLVARETIRLSTDAAAYVDQHVAPRAHKLKPAQLDRAVNEAIARHMPEEVERLAAESWDKRHVTIHDQLVSFTGTMTVEAELDIADALDLDAAVAFGAERRAALGSTEPLDVRRAQAVGDLARGQLMLDLSADTQQTRPVEPRQVVLYVHLSEVALRDSGIDPVARLERGSSLVSVDQVRSWCGRSDTRVTVTPVIDPDACTWSGSDAVPGRIKEKVAIRDHTCAFPWCSRPARTCDHDHVLPRGRNGPTCSCNIAPLCRRHHRLKTHSPWRYVVVDPGTYLWTSPHGYQFLKDPVGTHDVTDRAPRPAAAPDT
jgi:hypothetical protein